MNNDQITQLTNFLHEAMKATYAGGGKEVEHPQRPGFKELAFEEGDWKYRDSYCGFYQSWGEEVVWLKGKPFWTMLYGGGMEPEHHGNRDFAIQTFTFLKKAMSAKPGGFQPRGPKHFRDRDWEYTCEWEGGIKKFRGEEKITFKGKLVFSHWFFGGLVGW